MILRAILKLAFMVVVMGSVVLAVTLVLDVVALLGLHWPTLDSPPPSARLAMFMLACIFWSVGALYGLTDPRVLEMTDDRLIATCPLRVRHFAWHEVERVDLAWFFPVMRRQHGRYDIKHPLLIYVRSGGFPRFLYLQKFCISGQDSDIEAELRKRVPRAFSPEI